MYLLHKLKNHTHSNIFHRSVNYLTVKFFPVSHYMKPSIGVKTYSLSPFFFLPEITDTSFTN